jgi:hypothetical protein
MREGQEVGCEMVPALFNILRKLSECARVLAPFFEVASGYKRWEDASQFHSASRDGGQAARNFKLMSRCEPL